MTKTRTQLVERLADIARELASIADGLAEPVGPINPAVKSLVDELVRRGYCLSRDHKLNGAKAVRGMCRPHYGQATNAIKKGRTSESHLVANGWWTVEPLKGGAKLKIDSPFGKMLAGESPSPYAAMTDSEVIDELNRLTKPAHTENIPKTQAEINTFVDQREAKKARKK